jgi:hypothetical protein
MLNKYVHVNFEIHKSYNSCYFFLPGSHLCEGQHEQEEPTHVGGN